MGAGVGNMDKAVGWPPLEVFRFFDAAGRHESFAEAARELGVTSGAVAHRVRTLEHYLGEQSKGGTDHIDNLQLLCGACTSKKGKRTMAQLVAHLQAAGIRNGDPYRSIRR